MEEPPSMAADTPLEVPIDDTALDAIPGEDPVAAVAPPPLPVASAPTTTETTEAPPETPNPPAAETVTEVTPSDPATTPAAPAVTAAPPASGKKKAAAANSGNPNSARKYQQYDALKRTQIRAVAEYLEAHDLLGKRPHTKHHLFDFFGVKKTQGYEILRTEKPAEGVEGGAGGEGGAEDDEDSDAPPKPPVYKNPLLPRQRGRKRKRRFPETADGESIGDTSAMSLDMAAGAIESGAAAMAGVNMSMGPPAKKRTLLWDWTLTRDCATVPGIRETAGSLLATTSDTNPVASVTNWNTWRPTELPASLPFRPMVRTPAQLEGPDWTNLLANLTPTGTSQAASSSVIDPALQPQTQLDGLDGKVPDPPTIVHFYSEPEMHGITPADAVQAWRARMVPLRREKGIQLVSPACASNEAGSAWLAEFMALLSANMDPTATDHEMPDLLGLHFYTAAGQPVASEIENAQRYLSGMHEKYGLPAVVSEIASTSRDLAEVEQFTKELAMWMDAQSWVVEYGFFGLMRETADGFVSPAAQLLDAEGRWTGLGRWFAGL